MVLFLYDALGLCSHRLTVPEPVGASELPREHARVHSLKVSSSARAEWPVLAA